MPRWNQHGQLLMGNGGAVSVVTRDAFATWRSQTIADRAGVTAWLGPHHVMANHHVSGETWLTSAYDLNDPARGWQAYWSSGANFLSANQSGRWAAFANGLGVFGNIIDPIAGLTLAGTDGRGAAAPDGTIGIVAQYQQGTGLVLVDAAGVRFPVLGVSVARDVQILGLHRFHWSDDTRVLAVGITVGELLPGARGARYVESLGVGYWIYYAPAHGIVAHPVDRLDQGRIVFADDRAFHVDALSLGDELLVGASFGVGELPGEHRIVDALSLPIVDLRQPQLPVVAIGRDCYVCWYEHEAPTQLPPGNALLRIYSHEFFAQIETLDGSQVFNTAGLGIETVAEIEATVAASPLPVYAYWDANEWPRWPKLRPQDFLSIRAYCPVGVPIATFEAWLRATCAAAPVGPWLAVTCQCFTSNPGLSADLGGLVAMYARVARDLPRVRMLAVFNDAGRSQTGLAGHPEVRPLWQQLFAGVTGIPDAGGPVPEQMPADVYDVVRRMHERFATECIANHPGDNDGASRELTERIVQQVEFTFPGQGWCWKSADPNRPPSKDSLARLLTPFTSYDLFSASGANGPKFLNGYPPPANDISNPMQHPITDIPPKNWLDDQPQPGSLNVLIFDYTRNVRRSDPKGMTVYFEIESDQAGIEATFDLVEDGEDPIPLFFSSEPRKDGRYVRGIAFKPTINSPPEGYTLRVTAKDAAGRTGFADGPDRVHVGL